VFQKGSDQDPSGPLAPAVVAAKDSIVAVIGPSTDANIVANVQEALVRQYGVSNVILTQSPMAYSWRWDPEELKFSLVCRENSELAVSITSAPNIVVSLAVRVVMP
jgi:hypothetical protein